MLTRPPTGTYPLLFLPFFPSPRPSPPLPIVPQILLPTFSPPCSLPIPLRTQNPHPASDDDSSPMFVLYDLAKRILSMSSRASSRVTPNPSPARQQWRQRCSGEQGRTRVWGVIQTDHRPTPPLCDSASLRFGSMENTGQKWGPS
jgi:hypothetical protein